MNVYEKLIKVQAELKAPKSKFNSFGKYKYRSLEDILEGVKPLLEKNKASLVIADSIEQVGDRYYLKATATFIDTENGESVSNSALARESADKKGQDDSQITGTASSYARKYALNGLFLIDDTKDADTDEAHVEKEARAEKAKDDEKNEALVTDIGDMKIAPVKVNVLKGDIDSGLMNEEKMLAYFKVEKLEDVTEKQFSAYVQKRNKAGAEKAKK
jgi:hypothetical protein